MLTLNNVGRRNKDDMLGSNRAGEETKITCLEATGRGEASRVMHSCLE